MAKAIMIQGTSSDSGKTFLVAALCRIFAQAGYKVAPFKAQNMASDSYVTEKGEEIARSVAVQAFCAGCEPDARMNPILLKPVSDMGSQVIVNGTYRATMKGGEYFTHKKELIHDIDEAYKSLSRENDIIVIEGAGSPAEINLKQDDIVNMGVAKLVKSPVLLVGDIDRGGVFAAMAGTIQLLDERERNHVKGVVINKFRGELGILQPGLTMLEDIIHKPVIGVLPYLDVHIEKEDSMSQQDTVRDDAVLTVGIIRLPRMVHYAEFDALTVLPEVTVQYVTRPHQLGECDLVIIPGSGDVAAGLEWMNSKGIVSALKGYASKGGAVLGIAAGLAMLGESITVSGGTEIRGLEMLPLKSSVGDAVTSRREQGNVLFGGLLLDEEREYSGLCCSDNISFIKTGDTTAANICGATHHFMLEDANLTADMLNSLLRSFGLAGSIKPVSLSEYRGAEYDKLAEQVKKHLDMEKIYEILEQGIVED